MKTIWVIVIMVLVAAGLTLALISTAPDDRRGKGKVKDDDGMIDSGQNSVNVPVPGDWTTTPSGLRYEDIIVGQGPVAKAGDKISVHYTGTLTGGKKFDSSRDRNEPFSFSLGQGAVIRGWDEGVAGMKVGGKRKLWIPAELGYGASGSGKIPPNAELVFDIELLKVQ